MDNASNTNAENLIRDTEIRLTKWLIEKLSKIDTNWEEMEKTIRWALEEHRRQMANSFLVDEIKKAGNESRRRIEN